MSRFNGGKPYRGSSDVVGGKLQGSTAELDYFFFLCPKCADKNILRILDYCVVDEIPENPYNAQMSKKAKKGFTLAFQLYCEKCKFADFVKISNIGPQVGWPNALTCP